MAGEITSGKRVQEALGQRIDSEQQDILASHQAIEFSDIVVQALSSIVKSAGEMALRYFFKGRNGEIRPAHGIYEHLDSTR